MDYWFIIVIYQQKTKLILGKMDNQKIFKAIYYLMGLILLIHGVYQILTTTIDQGQLTYALIEIGIGLILWQQAKKP